jgi:hypothetical protein
MTERATTTVGLFADDLERLKTHQRRISFQKSDELHIKIWLTMPEVIHALINAAEAKTETGE